MVQLILATEMSCTSHYNYITSMSTISLLLHKITQGRVLITISTCDITGLSPTAFDLVTDHKYFLSDIKDLFD